MELKHLVSFPPKGYRDKGEEKMAKDRSIVEIITDSAENAALIVTVPPLGIARTIAKVIQYLTEKE